MQFVNQTCYPHTQEYTTIYRKCIRVHGVLNLGRKKSLINFRTVNFQKT